MDFAGVGRRRHDYIFWGIDAGFVMLSGAKHPAIAGKAYTRSPSTCPSLPRSFAVAQDDKCGGDRHKTHSQAMREPGGLRSDPVVEWLVDLGGGGR